MSVNVPSGSALPLSLLLFDGNTGLFPRAFVYDSAGTAVAGSPFTLTHSANGRYTNNAFTPGAEGRYTAVYITYTDAGFTIVANKYSREEDVFEVDSRVADITSILEDTATTIPASLSALDAKIDIIDTNVDAVLVDTGTTLPGTLSTIEGKIDTIDTNVDAVLVDTGTTLPGTLSTIEGKIDTIDTNVDAVLVDTGTTLPASLAVIDGNVDSILVDTGTTLPDTLATIETKAQADVRQAALIAEHDQTQLDISNIPATDISSLETKAQADARQAILVGEHNQTQSDIAGVDGKIDILDTNVDAILVDTGTTLPGTLSTLDGKIDTIDSNVDAVLVDTGTTLPGTLATFETKAQADARQSLLISEHNATQSDIATLENVSIADVQTAMTNQGYTGVRAVRLDNLDASISSRSTQTSVDNIQNTTTFQATVPVIFERPETGTQDWKILVRLYDTQGSPQDPDSNIMNLRLEKADDTIIVATTGMTRTAQGAYELVVSVSSALDLDQYIFYFEYAVGSVNFQQVRAFALVSNSVTIEDVEDGVNAIISTLGTPTLATLADDINSRQAESAALSRHNISVSERGSIQARVDLLEEETDALSRFSTTNTNIDANETKIDTLQSTVNTLETKAQADARQSALIVEHDATQATLATIETKAQADARQVILVAEHNQTQSDLSTVDSNVDSILVDTGTTLPATLATIETKAQADIRQAALIAEHDATQASLATVDGNVDSILEDTGTSIPATLATLETKAQADIRQAALVAEHDATQATLATQETKAQADARQALLVAEHDDTQVKLVNLDTKVGTPVDTNIATDIANVQARADLLEEESDASTRQAALIAEHDATQVTLATIETKAEADARQVILLAEHTQTQSDISDLDSASQGEHDQTQADIAALSIKVGTPVDTDLVTDLANVQARADLLETEADADTRNSTAVSERLAIKNRVDLLETDADAATRQTALLGEHTTTQGQLTSLDTKIGTPADTDVSTDIANVQARADLLETEADADARDTVAVNERSAIQSRVNLLETEADADARDAIAVSEREAIQNRVDLLQTDVDAENRHIASMAEHDQTQSDISDLSLGSTPLPEAVASAVWSEVLTGYNDPNTAGLFNKTATQASITTLDELTTGPNSLENIYQTVTDNNNDIASLASQSATETSTLSNQLGSVEDNLEGKILDNKADISTTNANVTSSKNAVIAEVNQNEVKIDSLDSKVSGIQNNTDVVAIVPERLLVPDVADSPKTYQLVVETFDDSGAPVNADSIPTVKIYNTDGSVYLAEANMVQDGVKVGIYLYDLIITDAQVAKAIRVEFKTIISAVTKYHQRPSEFVEYDGTLEAIEVKVDAIGVTTVDNNNLLTGANGLAQIKTEVLTNRTEINNNETKIDGIKTVTDSLPANIATQTMTDAIAVQVDSVPTYAELTAALSNQTSSIKGVSLKDLTQVFDNQVGTDNALLANDPRLDNLDVAISSRSTLTEAQVWSYVNRELTAAAPLSNVEVAKIWDYLTSAITVPGSIGKQIKDNLDAKMSSRSELDVVDMATLLFPIAKEVTVVGLASTVATENNENQILLNQALAFLNNIKPQTDKIVNGGATDSTVISTSNQTQVDIATLELIINNIRNKTDNLPVDPAKETSVQSIPTNPLETDDARLSLLNNLTRLDVAVSTRAASIPSDYATKTDLLNTESAIISEVNANEAKIDSLPGTSYFNSKFAAIDYASDFSEIKGAGFNTSNHSLVEIRTNQDNISGGSGATAAQVWQYADRSLTDYPDFATPQDIALSENKIIDDVVDALSYFNCAMTTTIDTNNDKQVVLCWLNLNGQTVVVSENARIEVRDDNGVIWAGSAITPDTRGVFKIEKSGINALITGTNKNYTINITVEYQGQDYSTSQPFYTVG